jgi:hypothetical protein
VIFRVKVGLKPKSRTLEKEVIIMKTDHIPTISVGIIFKISGRSNIEEAIFKKVAA